MYRKAAALAAAIALAILMVPAAAFAAQGGAYAGAIAPQESPYEATALTNNVTAKVKVADGEVRYYRFTIPRSCEVYITTFARNARLYRANPFTTADYDVLNTGREKWVLDSGTYWIAFVGATDDSVRYEAWYGEISSSDVSFPEQVAYTGSEVKPKPTVKVDGLTLREGDHYTVGYSDNVGPGTAHAEVRGTGAYSGSVAASFEIVMPKDIAGATVTKPEPQLFTGKPVTPDVTVRYGGKLLERGVDYELSYDNNVGKGKNARVTVSGKGLYTGSKDVLFEIYGPSTLLSNDLSDATVEPIASVKYTGKAITPEVSASINGTALRRNVDYTVEMSDNVNAGTAKVVLRGIGEYVGETETTFTIKKAKAVIPTLRTVYQVKTTKIGKTVKYSVLLRGYKNLKFTKISGDKKLTINNSGVVTVKKGLKLKKSDGYWLKKMRYSITVPGDKNHTGNSAKMYFNVVCRK